MASNWFFQYQRHGGEDAWVLDFADNKAKVLAEIRPAFTTALDLSAIPDDGDWSKVRYRGPMYFDFDAAGDLPLACTQFLIFLDKLENEFGFDLKQASLFLSGGKGFHITIPAECFQPKVPATGTAWLPYVYRTMAEAMVVDTMDLLVYTGKRGRMWRTANVQRDSGTYKVPITPEEAWTITPDLYAELCAAPREVPPPSPASCNSKLAMLFNLAREKVVAKMRGKKKRVEQASTLLDPWRKSKTHPPTMLGLMDGSLVNPDAGFQSLSMQLAIYATTVGLGLDEYLERCRGLCENHVSDSYRYNTFAKRQEELARMWRYMAEDNSEYDYAVGPLVNLVKPGVSCPDLGVMATEDTGDVRDDVHVAAPAASGEEGDAPPVIDAHMGIRRGVFMNADGIFKRGNDTVESLCRASIRKVDAFYHADTKNFQGYQFNLTAHGMTKKGVLLGADAFTSANSLRKFFAAHQLSFMGGEPETAALLDIMSEKAAKGGRVFVYPREGFFIINNPLLDEPTPVKVYLTEHAFMSSVPVEDPAYFRMRYRPESATNTYNIDIHRAPELDETMVPALHDLLSFNRHDVVADMVGWFVACHYRSVYLHLFRQFPLLQMYGEAGSGKTQTTLMLGHLHWYMNEVSLRSASSDTPYVVDCYASSSTSAPYLIDEFKPREMRALNGARHPKLKDVFKASYVGSSAGGRGTVNKAAADNPMATINSRCTAPIAFMAEAIEMETAIIERSVCVNFSKSYLTNQRKQAFKRLEHSHRAISALGREIVECGFGLDLDEKRASVESIIADINAGLPDFDDLEAKRPSERSIFNRAVIIDSLRTLKVILKRRFGTEFDAPIDALLEWKADEAASEQAKVIQSLGISEISKVLNRISLLSQDVGRSWEMREDKDYIVGDGWVEIKLARAYDNYRLFCSATNDTPLFDSLDTFIHATNSYSPCIDRLCVNSELRADGSSERIARFDTTKLTREGVQTFNKR